MELMNAYQIVANETRMYIVAFKLKGTITGSLRMAHTYEDAENIFESMPPAAYMEYKFIVHPD